MSTTQFTGKIIVRPSADEITAHVARLFEDMVRDAVARNGVCNVALAGGTTPHALYQRLARDATSSDVPWQSVHFYFGDERDVPQDNVESNYHMVQRALLDYVPVNPDNIHPMPADASDLNVAAGEYEEVIRTSVKPGEDRIPRFDLILLGMGGDGHTASLFPFTDALAHEHRLIVSHYVPVLGRNRMTFTFPLINAARNVLLLVTGDDKADAIATLLGDDQAEKDKLPVSRINPKEGELILALDSHAAKYVHLANSE